MARNITKLEAKLREIIEACVADDVYPSAAEICTRMRRTSWVLSGPECVVRRKIFAEMGIMMKSPMRVRGSHAFNKYPINKYKTQS